MTDHRMGARQASDPVSADDAMISTSKAGELIGASGRTVSLQPNRCGLGVGWATLDAEPGS